MASGRRSDPPPFMPDDSAPDAGLRQMVAQMTAQAGAAVGVGQPAAAPRAPDPWGGGPAGDDVWPLRPPPIPLTSGATVDSVDWGPPTGRAWRIYRAVILLGTASQVTIYRNAVQPIMTELQVSVSGSWEPGMCMLLPGERLIAVAAGGTATIRVTDGDQIGLRYLPRYLL